MPAAPHEKLPVVSVIMTVFNGERHLREAIDSIMLQTFQDWECIVVDDGSTDGTRSILDSYKDQRIRIILDPHRGRGAALNRGVEAARGSYFAILDADDAALPERLAVQVEYMETHAEIGMAGSDLILRSEHTASDDVETLPRDDFAIRRAFPKSNPFCHSCIIIRRHVFEQAGGYSTTLPCSLDYDLYSRVLRSTRVANIPSALAIHRIHKNQRFLAGIGARTRERTASNLRLKSVRLLGLPWSSYSAPLLYYLIVRLPGFLRPAALIRWAKRLLANSPH